MPELLLELGTEELPASFVRRAYTDLQEGIRALLAAEGIEVSGISLGTPRRQIVSFQGLPTQQPDKAEEKRGPAIASAFDADGKPTKALEGFCRGQGVDVSSVRKDEQYVWITKHTPGRPTRDLLAEILPKAIRGLNFDKSMRWGSSRLRFARPIRWILAAFDGSVVPFDIEGVASGTQSRGHRFYAPDAFEATDYDALLSELRNRKVEPDPALRQASIIDQSKAVAGGIPDLPEALVDENVFLTEWPTAIVGTYPEALLELPEPVLVTAMAKHEKMFPVRGTDGKLLNRFVFIRNNGEDETVRKGCEWVLNARFNDARFFFEEDKKSTLADFLEKTTGIVFQEKLGTVRERSHRLAALSAFIADWAGQNDDLAHQAGLYAKADLATGLVSELASLQGVVGEEYARREGFPEPVCRAIGAQYDLRRAGEHVSLASCLVAADALDKLAGYLGLGLVPSGSSDPYGLRRAATQLIEIGWNWPTSLPDWSAPFAEALKLYTNVMLDEDAAKIALTELFANRYTAMLSEVRYDILDAAILAPLDPRNVRFRVSCLEGLVGDSAFVQTATRPINLVASATTKGLQIGAPTADDDLSTALLAALDAAESETKSDDPATVIRALQALAAPINAYLDGTMVMVDDEAIRAGRLGMLKKAADILLTAGNFTKIVG